MRTSNSPPPQIAEDLDALQGVDVGVQVADADAELGVVLGQILGHALGEGGDEDALAGRALADLVEQVVDLAADGAHLDRGSSRPVGRMICSTTTPPSSRPRSRPAWR